MGLLIVATSDWERIHANDAEAVPGEAGPLLVLNGPDRVARQCLLPRVEQTFGTGGSRSQFDPKRKLIVARSWMHEAASDDNPEERCSDRVFSSLSGNLTVGAKARLL